MLVFSNNLLPASVAAYASCFALTFFFLSGRAKLLDRLMVSVATTVSGIWLYEIFYHYSWGFGGLTADLSRLSIAIGGVVPFPIYFAVALVILPLLARQYFSLNVQFFLVLAVSLEFFGIWMVLGFPQFWCTCEYRTAIGNFIPGPLTEQVGYVMNSLTKLLSVVPAFLFYKPALIRSEKTMDAR